MKIAAFCLIFLLLGFIGKKPEDISQYLDKKKEHKALKQFMRSFGEAPDDVYQSTDSYYDNYHSQGISFNFDYQDKLIALFVYSGEDDKFKKFNGPLPNGLSFDWTRKEVEARFGPPDYQGDLSYKNSYWVIYRSKGFGITYRGLETDTLAKISEITFQPYR